MPSKTLSNVGIFGNESAPTLRNIVISASVKLAIGLPAPPSLTTEYLLARNKETTSKGTD